MTFTNTDCVEHDFCWQELYVQVDDQVWNQVDDQLNWKVYGQINLIKSKIRREINK
jgi:hypothetical protein